MGRIAGYCSNMAVSAAIMAAVYFTTTGIHNLIVLLLVRISLAIVVYFMVMKLLGSKILDECVNYLFHKNNL